MQKDDFEYLESSNQMREKDVYRFHQAAWQHQRDRIFAHMSHAAYFDADALGGIFKPFGAEIRFYDSKPIIDDLDFLPMTYREGNGESKLHRGFYKAIQRIWPKVERDLKQLDLVTSVVPKALYHDHGIEKKITDIDGADIRYDHSIINYACILGRGD